MSKIIKKILGIIFIFIISFSSVFILDKNNFLSNINYKITDNFYILQETKKNDEIIIVSIDDYSLLDENLGIWQDWTRDYYATVIENIQKSNPAVIGIDILFLNERKNDESLSHTLQKYNNIILANKYSPATDIFLKPNEKFINNKKKLGFINIPIEKDNIVRTAYPFLKHDNNIYESFDLKIARFYITGSLHKDTKNNITKNIYKFTNHTYRSAFGEKKRFEPINIPIYDNKFYFNFYGDKNHFNTISFYDVYKNNFDKEFFKDKIVLIGIKEATGINDYQYTPISYGEPLYGIDIHANIIANILNDDFIILYDKNYILYIIFSIILTILFFILNPFINIFIFLFSIFFTFVIGLSFFYENIIIKPFYIILLIFNIYILYLLYNYIIETKEKKFLKNAFSKYVSKYLVKQIINNPKKLNLGGQKKEITIFFSDIANFTEISEKFNPEQIVDILNKYLSLMTNILINNQGMLDKYIGDGIMAIWGAPLDIKNSEYLACKTALEMIENLKIFNKKYKKFKINIRIGINTGKVIVGNIGSEKRFDYTVIGDNVNIASRLEAINKQYDSIICVSEKTYKKVKDKFLFRFLDNIKVKGKNKPIKIYELIDNINNKEMEDMIFNFEKGIKFYQDMNFKKAIKEFKQCYKKFNDKVSLKYIERCQYLIKNPPSKNWDKISVYKIK